MGQGNLCGTTKAPTVWLTSGQEIQLEEIELHETELLQRAAKCRAEAAKALGGTGTALGIIGTPGLTLAAEWAAASLIAGMFASSAQKAALEKLSEAQRIYQKARTTARWFKASEVSNLDTNDPIAWVAEGELRKTQIDLTAMEKEARMTFCEKHNIKYSVFNPYASVPQPVPYAHNGEDFVRVRTGTGVMSFRWSSVACYRPPMGDAGNVG